MGAMTNAVTATHTQRPGKIRRNRALQYSPRCGRRIQLAVIRKPETVKNPSTQTSLSNRTAG